MKVYNDDDNDDDYDNDNDNDNDNDDVTENNTEYEVKVYAQQQAVTQTFRIWEGAGSPGVSGLRARPLALSYACTRVRTQLHAYAYAFTVLHHTRMNGKAGTRASLGTSPMAYAGVHLTPCALRPLPPPSSVPR